MRGTITVPDAIGARYRSPAAQGLSAVAILVAVVGYMATNILALGLVIDSIFGTGLGWGVWIGMAVVLGYSVAGGIMAGIYTDMFQGTLMAVASVLVFVYTLRVGGGIGEISAPCWRRTRRSWGRSGRWGRWRRSRCSSCSGWAPWGSPTWSTSSTCSATRGS